MSQRIDSCPHYHPLHHHPLQPILSVGSVIMLRETMLGAVVSVKKVGWLDEMSVAVAKPFGESSGSAVAM